MQVSLVFMCVFLCFFEIYTLYYSYVSCRLLGVRCPRLVSSLIRMNCNYYTRSPCSEWLRRPFIPYRFRARRKETPICDPAIAVLMAIPVLGGLQAKDSFENFQAEEILRPAARLSLFERLLACPAQLPVLVPIRLYCLKY